MKKVLSILLFILWATHSHAQFWNGTSATTNYIYRTGSLSIGTNYSGAKFTVGGSVNKSHFYHGLYEDVYLRPGTNSGKVIMDIGNVGIGTTSPTEKLQIGNGFTFHNGGHHVLGLGWAAGNSVDLNASGYAAELRLDPVNGLLRLGVSSSITNAPETRVTINKSGAMGIGTTSPKSTLHVAGNTPLDWQGNAKGSGLLTLANPSGNGTLFINTPTHNSFYSAGLGIDGTYDNRHSEINIKAFGVKYNAWHSSLVFHTSNGENLNEVMRLDKAGNVGIGTTSPTEKLSVDGTVLAKKVRVSTTGWPDYVFAPNYELQSLSQVEKFIKENQHLPEVPSAKEIEEKGQDLGDIQATLLKKVEELTLYLIQENKEKEKLKKENLELKALFLELKKEIESIKTQNQ